MQVTGENISEISMATNFNDDEKVLDVVVWRNFLLNTGLLT